MRYIELPSLLFYNPATTLVNIYMKEVIFVLGGDGFCGWPTALHLSNRKYEVIIIDNLSRRKIDIELGTSSLTPISTIEKRISKWKEISGNEMKFYMLDLQKDYSKFLSLINEYSPKAIVHFAEQRSAPYSMKSTETKQYTVNNNLNVTNNVLQAIVESGKDIHLVHLGTMGVYGYGTAGLEIPEGYLQAYVKKDSKYEEIEIMYPAHPGSIYHLTKTQDALFFYFYNKNDAIRITDLHQGIVWGTNTKLSMLDEALINRFDYDSDYGTVLNRFLMQASLNYPLTVYGTGGQTRAFININDTVECILLAIQNPPKKGDRVKIFNQATETHNLLQLAQLVSKMTGVKIDYLPNPRKEADANNLRVKNDNFLNLGLKPTKLNEGLLSEVIEIVEKYKHRVDSSKIPPKSLWNNEIRNNHEKTNTI